ncbi:MAG: hydrolase 2, exosortase A system-associated [Telluria sp.]
MAARGFFLAATAGQRYCLHHEPPGPVRGAVLYVHPFAEEMNKSRHMAALQARAFAAAGYAVLQLDLLGCGDSSGDFAHASWHAWLEDVALGARWLRGRHGCRVSLWGLRLGGLLAAQAASEAVDGVDSLLLWAPVREGEAFLNQFLRLRSAAGMLGSVAREPPRAVRTALAQGHSVEVAGYDLAPALAEGIAAAVLSRCRPRADRAAWIDIGIHAGDPQSLAGVETAYDTLAGPAFWNTQEIATCPALVGVTLAMLEARAHAC